MREGKYSPVYGSMPLSMPMPATLVAVRGGGIGEGVQEQMPGSETLLC